MYEEKFGHAVAEEVVSEMALSSFSEQELTLTSLVPMVQHLCLWHLRKDMQGLRNSSAKQDLTLTNLIAMLEHLCIWHLSTDMQTSHNTLANES